MFVVVVVVVIVIIVCSLVGKVSDKRVNVLKLEHIPNDAPGCLRKTDSLSEFQDHPELRHNSVRSCLFVYLFVSLIICLQHDPDSVSLSASLREDPLTPRGDLSPSSSYETIRRVQTFNDRQEKPALELRRISTSLLLFTFVCEMFFVVIYVYSLVNLPPTDTRFALVFCCCCCCCCLLNCLFSSSIDYRMVPDLSIVSIATPV